MPLGQRSIEQSLPLGYRRSGLLGLAGYGRDALRALPGVAQEWAARQATADAARAEATRGNWRALIGEDEPYYTEPEPAVAAQPAGAIPKREDGMAVVVRTPPALPPPGESLPPSMRRGPRAIDIVGGGDLRGQERGLQPFQRGGGWTGVGGGPRNLAQLEQDIKARGLLEAENAAVLEGIESAEAVRGDPRARAIEARQLDLGYESLLPAGSESRIEASYPLGERTGAHVDIRRPLGGYTIGETRAIEQARIKPFFGEEAKYAGAESLVDQQVRAVIADPAFARLPRERQEILLDEAVNRARQQKLYMRKLGIAGGWPGIGAQTGPDDSMTGQSETGGR